MGSKVKPANAGRRIKSWLSLSFLTFAVIAFPDLAIGKSVTRINGVEYISLPAVAGKFGLSYKWLQKSKRATLSGQRARLEFELHQRDFRLNGVKWRGGAE